MNSPDNRIMIACEKKNPKDGSFCCFGDPCTDGGKCFPDEGKLLSFGNQEAETTISIGGSTTYGLVSPTTSRLAPVDSLSENSTQHTASQASPTAEGTNSLRKTSVVTSASSRSSTLLSTHFASGTPRSGSTIASSASATPTTIPKISTSTGAKVGVGLGVASGIALLAALIFWWRKRQTHHQLGGNTNRDGVSIPPLPEKSTISRRYFGFPPSELENGRIINPRELANTNNVSELPNEGTRSELPMPPPTPS